MLLSRRQLTTAALAAIAGCAAPKRRAPRAAEHALSGPNHAETLESKPIQRDPPSPVAEVTTALGRAYPALHAKLPQVSLGLFPTPVERAGALGDAIGVGSLWVKRDDVSGAAYGGGKVRKLEYLLGEASRVGAEAVLTSGGVGSNHALATAIYAAQLGLGAILDLLPEPADDRVRAHLLADVRFGAEVRIARARTSSEVLARRLAAERGTTVFPIAAGGSSVLGNVGFVDAAFELAEQVSRGELPVPDVVYLAMGTMGSAVGLAIGLRAAGLRTRVVAVRASSPGTSSEARMLEMAAETETYLRSLDASFPAVQIGRGDITVAGGHLGAGYGRPTRKGVKAVELAREHASLALDHVYTGKALAALIDGAERSAKDVVLFWNSHNGRELDVRDVDWHRLPPELHGYFAGRKGI